jgi:hypothetical protein
VSKELTEIEKARLFAASVLAETERRTVPGGGDNGPALAVDAGQGQQQPRSWWKQKVSSLQHEL